MTSKTIKTVLFASLIVAMILPFSGMPFATAQETSKTKEIDIEKFRSHIDAKTKALEEEITKNSSLQRESENEPLNKQLVRYSQMSSLVDLKEELQDTVDESVIEELNIKALKIIENLRDTYGNDEVEIAKEIVTAPIRQVSGGHDVDFYALQHRQPDCYNPNHEYAWMSGNGEAKSTGTIIEVTATSYPTAVGTGVIGNCDTEYDDYYFSGLTSAITGSCNIWINPSSGSYEANCTSIKWNDIIAVTTQASYGWYTEDYATAGWDIMLT